MDVFSLLNFWRNAGVGHPITTPDFDFTDDDTSFFDLVFTNAHADNSNHNNRELLPLDSSRSPFRVLKLRFHNNNNNNKNRSCSDKKFLEPTPSKRFSKDVVHKYLNLIKPLYVKVSGKPNNKVRFPERSPATSSEFCPRKDGKPTVFKRLAKSRSSTSSAGKVTPSPGTKSSDSALQQDGIQSAIMHCKKSYGSPISCEVLSRSGSVPYQESRISIEEQKRSSI